jgi:hypothetical protein
VQRQYTGTAGRIENPGWRQGRPMFTYADGRPIRPEYLTHRFRTHIKELDLPPIRLHDMRHGAATLAGLAHRPEGHPADARPLQHRHHRRHLHQRPARDPHRAAQATADMVTKAARTIPGARRGGATLPHIPAAVTASGYCQM